MRRHGELGGVLAYFSHLDDGALGSEALDAPHVLVTALSTVSAGKAQRTREEIKEAELEAKKSRGKQ